MFLPTCKFYDSTTWSINYLFKIMQSLIIMCFNLSQLMVRNSGNGLKA